MLLNISTTHFPATDLGFLFHKHPDKFQTSSGAVKVLDLGCREGKLIRELLKEKQFTEIAGMDVSYGELMKAKERLRFDEMSPKQKERITLFQGSLMYKANGSQGSTRRRSLK